jgi:hypothetical protein
MKVFVFTYDRYDSISTPSLLEQSELPHVVLCHSNEARQKFIDAGRVTPGCIVATKQPKGLANNRNAALDMMDDGEWAVFFVDDLKSVTELGDYGARKSTRLGITTENQSAFRRLFAKEITLKQFMLRASETAAACEAVGANLGGFCGIANPLFRDAKWRFNVLADGRAWVVRKTSLRFDTNAQLIDDLCWTARNIQKFGCVVVNQWVLPDCKRYTAGAYGSIEQRMPQKLKEASHLVKTYPSLIRVADKAGWPRGSHVVLRRTLNNKQIIACEAAVISATRRFAPPPPW